MGQVPTYSIIGNGRLALHMMEYFRLLKIPYYCWHRSLKSQQLKETLDKSQYVLLAVSDSALASVTEQIQALTDQPLFHCSGSLKIDGAEGFHPLMTFGPKVYDLEFYQKILFVHFGSPLLHSKLPGLPNTTVALEDSQRTRYHLNCVMGGNFTQMLWSEVIGQLSKDFKLPKEHLAHYAKAAIDNIFENENALTGPHVRNDENVISAHLEELKDSPWERVYRAFTETYREQRGQK